MERLERPDKHYKFNPGDVDERGHWLDYMEAYQAAFDKTSTVGAPGTSCPRTASGTPASPSSSCSSRRCARWSSQWPQGRLRRRAGEEAPHRELTDPTTASQHTRLSPGSAALQQG